MSRFLSPHSIEVLEQKRMMASNLIGNAMAAMPAASNAVQASGITAGAVNGAGAATSAVQNVAGATRLGGTLTGTGQGNVNLVSSTNDGSTAANLLVHVSG